MERIDLDAVIRRRLPDRYSHIPQWLIRGAERLICQDRLNAILDNAGERRDAEFCRSVIEYLNVSYDINGTERLPEPGPGSRVIFTCNHPLGALDGIIIIDMLSQRYGPGLRFIVNDLLNAVEPLSGVFLPINKHGRQSREAAEAIDAAMSSDNPVVIFPAGLCSRASWTGRVADLAWNKMFVGKALRYHRDIIPLHFSGRNSALFYLSAKLRELAGIKFNAEMILLPRQIFRSTGRRYTISVGERIPADTLRGGTEAEATAAAIRALTYTIPNS